MTSTQHSRTPALPSKGGDYFRGRAPAELPDGAIPAPRAPIEAVSDRASPAPARDPR